MTTNMKQWSVKPIHKEEAESLSRQLQISPLIAQLLINRDIREVTKVEEFLFHSLKNLPNPFELKDMDKAVSRIVEAIQKKEKAVVYGDYDVDGTTATALLLRFFREIGYPIDFYIPHRLKEGYSLNEQAVRELHKKGAKVIITVDNGIMAMEEALLIKELGMDLIITDHHEVPDSLPVAHAIVNPHRKDCAYPSKEICGAGVAFNLVMALRQKLRAMNFFREIEEPNLKKYLDLVALATVADVVPLTGANRILVKYGLQQINATLWPGLRALKEVSAVKGNVTATHLGFRLGPRLNACGRLYDATMGVELLISDDDEKALEIAAKLDSANRERQDLEKQIYRQAVDLLEKDPHRSQRMGHVLYQKGWHPGVLGIVASRLAERYCRPFILLGQDGERLKGSARSYGGLNLIDALRSCDKWLIKCGGHKAAAGLSLYLDKLEDFQQNFEREVQSKLSEEHCIPRMKIDAELNLGEIDLRLLDELKLLEPFGQGNPEPLFCLKATQSRGGRVVGERHLKFQVEKENKRADAIAFGMAEQTEMLKHSVDVAFICQLNEYRGLKSVVLNVRDLKRTEK